MNHLKDPLSLQVAYYTQVGSSEPKKYRVYHTSGETNMSNLTEYIFVKDWFNDVMDKYKVMESYKQEDVRDSCFLVTQTYVNTMQSLGTTQVKQLLQQCTARRVDMATLALMVIQYSSAAPLQDNAYWMQPRDRTLRLGNRINKAQALFLRHLFALNPTAFLAVPPEAKNNDLILVVNTRTATVEVASLCTAEGVCEYRVTKKEVADEVLQLAAGRIMQSFPTTVMLFRAGDWQAFDDKLDADVISLRHLPSVRSVPAPASFASSSSSSA
jgi:hypothetical protein